MQDALNWLSQNDAHILRGLADLVAVPSISNDGRHAAELDQSAALVARQMSAAGLRDVEVLRISDSYPYVFGQRLDAPGRPTVFFYAHHDVQPVNEPDQWQSPPFTLTERDGRLFGRGAADDKAAISAQLAAIEAVLKTVGKLPVNVKMLVEGEEEIGSKNLLKFFATHRERIASDVIVVCDTENINTGIPCLTYSLRGVIGATVTVEGMSQPSHSGMVGGSLPDPAIGLAVLLSRLCWGQGDIPIPGLYDGVRSVSGDEKTAMAAMPISAEQVRADTGLLPGVDFAERPGVSFCETTWRRPAVTVIAMKSGDPASPSNQVQPKATALISIRTVPGMSAERVIAGLREVLTRDVPWNLRVSVDAREKHVDPWMTDPKGPAFSAAMSALKAGYGGVEPLAIGCGGSIGFVGPLAELLGGAPALLLGIEDPKSNAHAPNESLHADDFRKLTRSLVHLMDNLGRLDRVK